MGWGGREGYKESRGGGRTLISSGRGGRTQSEEGIYQLDRNLTVTISSGKTKATDEYSKRENDRVMDRTLA